MFEKRVRAQTNHKMTRRALKYLRSFKLVRLVYDMLHKVSSGQKITMVCFFFFPLKKLVFSFRVFCSPAVLCLFS